MANNSLLQLMHDTMSPVNTIKGAVDLLKKGNLSPEDTTKLLDAIKERADKLNEVLDAYYVSAKLTIPEWIVFKLNDGGKLEQISDPFDSPEDAKNFVTTMNEGFNHKNTKLFVLQNIKNNG